MAPAAPPTSAGSAATASRPIVDHAVVPAGGAACRHCPGGAFPVHGGHRGHLDGCRDGLCAPHCPVRPVEYGFYSTQWRRWPGQGVVPASAEQSATPVSPPSSLVPSAEQESPVPPADVAPPAQPAADGRDEDRAAAPDESPRVRKPADPLPEEPGAAARPPDREVAPGMTVEHPLSASSASPPPHVDAAATLDETDASQVVPAGLSTTEPAGMRYPAAVGRSLAAGASPWRIQPEARQRPAASARGR